MLLGLESFQIAGNSRKSLISFNFLLRKTLNEVFLRVQNRTEMLMTIEYRSKYFLLAIGRCDRYVKFYDVCDSFSNEVVSLKVVRLIGSEID